MENCRQSLISSWAQAGDGRRLVFGEGNADHPGLMLIGVPVAFAIMTAGFSYLVTTGTNLMMLPQRLVYGLNSFTLLAVPLFIFVGNLMDSGGISKRLTDWAKSLLGWLPGGLGVVTVFSCAIFAALTGSGPATVAAIGSIMLPAMIKGGHSRETSAGLVAAAGALGPIIPPSIPMIIYGVTMSLSIPVMFVAGIVPGLVIAFALSVVNIVIAFRQPEVLQHTKEMKFDFKYSLKMFWKALSALGLPVLILGGIYSGVFTPTESAAIGIVYALIVSYRRRYPAGARVSFREGLRVSMDALWGLGTIVIIMVGVCTGICTVTESAALAAAYSVFVTFVIYRDISVRELIPIFRDGFKKVANVMFLIAASGAFGWLLAYIRVPQMTADAVLSVTGSRIGVIVLINVILLFLGMICDMGPVIIIATPVFLPIAELVGIDPVHFGIILLLNLGIGLTTPPVGAALFSVCSIGKVSMGRAVKGTLPMYGVMLLVLVIINLFPDLVLFLPHLVRGL